MQVQPSSFIDFKNGIRLKNRFMLAPLTNQQSHADGSVSNDELNWLIMRAKGQFGLVMTCASHVNKLGQGFPGQLGIHNDTLIPGHKKISQGIQSYGSIAIIQLHHAGMRSPASLIGQAPLCPSSQEKYGARAMSFEEIVELKNDFISAAIRAQKSGYDGVEVHGAHGYIITQFLSSKINTRTDIYGGSLENRSRLLFEIIKGIRLACGNEFLVGVRISPERFGMKLEEAKSICQRLFNEGIIDFLDLSLWDCFKYPEEDVLPQMKLIDHFTSLDKRNVLLTVSGKLRNADDVLQVLKQNVDFVTIGRSGIIHHDFPKQVMENPLFKATRTPLTRAYLKEEGLGDAFIEYLQRWPKFVAEEV